jgi:hypothetical protein
MMMVVIMVVMINAQCKAISDRYMACWPRAVPCVLNFKQCWQQVAAAQKAANNHRSAVVLRSHMRQHWKCSKQQQAKTNGKLCC